MKRMLISLIVVGMVAVGCANTGRYNTQKGAAIGAGIGALMGQAIGRSTESTLIGAGAGTLLGSVFGNMEDQRAAENRDRYAEYQSRSGQEEAYGDPDEDPYPTDEPQYPPPRISRNRYAAPEPQVLTQPPGEWVKVPGHWEGNVWVPAHQEWRPIRPK
ncbi:MAG: hypothetical protein JEZ11_27310 [Desulfobacterales bacterium]|nr:hypothetical protein [Desulfobacterales bacterium]